MAKGLTKKPTKKSKSTPSSHETPKPAVGFFKRLSANKTLGNVVVGSVNLVCFATHKLLNMTWVAVTFAALFLTPAYKSLAADLEESEKATDNPDQYLAEGIMD
ncbi:hypothetical protein RB653_002306 [Dictyostelium firmibasis]|uniref:Uncharacterized protein n=1 Tax=Dictyostelium firmibasis TaxID=79012 RepID=A0AAN7U2S1_9MYCE